MSEYIVNRLGTKYTMQVVPAYGGLFLSGETVYAVVRRHSDGAMFNFKIYNTNPSDSNVWALPGAFPVDLTELQGQLTEFKIGATSLAYMRDWTFPENDATDNVDPILFTIWYVSPGTLGLIGVETVAFIPRSLSFNAYYATPMDQANISVLPG